jgi:hypothetical protein
VCSIRWAADIGRGPEVSEIESGWRLGKTPEPGWGARFGSAFSDRFPRLPNPSPGFFQRGEMLAGVTRIHSGTFFSSLIR